VFDLRLAQCRPYYLFSFSWSVFCSKLALLNTSSLRETGTNPIHFDSDSPQDQKIFKSNIFHLLCGIKIGAP
jgi:hypothetical protein